MQLQAGYILEALPSLFAGSQREYVEALIKHLSYFDLDAAGQDLSPISNDPFPVVIHNLISRGLPTLAPTFIEEIISATFFKTKKQVDKRGVFSYPFVNDELKEEIFRALHIIDPRITTNDLQKIYTFEDDPEADLKKKFLFQTVPSYVGDYLLQLIDADHSFLSILKRHSLKDYYQALGRRVIDTSMDFVLEVPYAEDNQYRGLAIEIEKKLVEGPEIMDYDSRSWMLSNIGWGRILYLKQSDFYSNKIDYAPLVDFSYNQYFEEVRKNYERPVYGNAYGMDALQIALTPFEVARIQRVILQYILAGKLDLNAGEWNIAVIERDVPGAFLAVQDLSMKFNNLFHLAGVRRNFPQVHLEIYYDQEFEEAALNILYQGEKFLIEEFDPTKQYDLVIDSSLLRYKGLDVEKIDTASENLAIVRSSRNIEADRTFLAAEPVKYQSFVPGENIAKDDLERVEKVRESFFYFIKNIFRRQILDPYQMKVLSSALSGHNTMADFSFVAEKTLLYQIVALFRPGFALIVEPLVPALLNQLDKLREFRIDAVSYICLNYYDVYDCRHRRELFASASALFVFITAEAFHSNDFRSDLKLFESKGGFFTTVVVDQTQILSPWSSSFNYAYYSLGNNVKKFLPGSENAVILALSSGIDYDATEDVKLFLDISQDNIFSEVFPLENIDVVLYKDNQDNVVPLDKLDEEKVEQDKINLLIDNDLLDEKSVIYTLKPDFYYDNLFNKVKKDLFLFNDRPVSGTASLYTRHSVEAYEHFRQFVDSEDDLLIANRNFVFGLDAKDIHNLNVVSFPMGMTDLLYLFQRVGRDMQPARINFVFSSRCVYFDQKQYIISGNEPVAIRQTREIPYEEYVASRFFSSMHGNVKKDFLLVEEILKLANSPKDTVKDILIKRVYQIFGIWVSLEPQPEQTPTSLYVYDQEDILGVINLKENTIDNQASALKKKLADNILAFIDYEIRQVVARPQDFLLIMDETVETPSETIISRLVNMKEDETASIIVDFTNDIYDDLVKLAGKDKISREDFNRMILANPDLETFYDFILLYTDKKFVRKNKDKLEEIFLRLRTFDDTYRLIYYLLVVGLAEDYIIDFRSRHFVIKLRKLSDDKYLHRIYKRILTFVSKEKALETFQKVPGFKGDTFVQKVLNYWISFEYTYIIPRRYEAISDLSRMIDTFMQNGDVQRCKYIISNYFRAKYIFDLEERKKAVKQDWIKIIDYFIQKVGIFKSNLKHLYNTADILLQQNPGDYVALLMRGWAGLIINENDEAKISQALDDMAMALNLWRKTYDADVEKFIERIDGLLFTLENYNFELKAKVEKLFHLKIFTSWLRDFNKQFIDLT